MDDHSMRRYVPVLVAGAALIAAACSEPVAPVAPPTQEYVPVLSAHITMAPANMWYVEQAGTYTFTINPWAGKAKIGAYTLTYDAYSVCNPATSTYGPSEWKKSCSVLTSPITITAKFWTEDGRTYADFSPDIRFDPSKNVAISARVPGIRGEYVTDAMREQYKVFYTRVVDGMRYFIDEAATDPSLATVFGTNYGRSTGWINRRVLHFSGYYVRSGRVCDETSGACSDGSIDAVDVVQ